jgi:hypothetical protein
LELQHLTDEDDVQRLNYEDFGGWVWWQNLNKL